MEAWLEGLDSNDRVITCIIVRGEILFGISRLPEGKRREELRQTALSFLDTFHCEPIPEGAAQSYATVKLQRQQLGLSLDENDLWIAATALAIGATLITRDKDFKGVVRLTVFSPG